MSRRVRPSDRTILDIALNPGQTAEGQARVDATRAARAKPAITLGSVLLAAGAVFALVWIAKRL